MCLSLATMKATKLKFVRTILLLVATDGAWIGQLGCSTSNAAPSPVADAAADVGADAAADVGGQADSSEDSEAGGDADASASVDAWDGGPAAIDGEADVSESGSNVEEPNVQGDVAEASTLGDGLVSLWSGEGNATDSVGPNGGTVQGGVSFVSGKIGQAFEFDGTTGDVLVPTSTTLNVTTGHTIAFWIKVPSWPAQLTLITCKWANGQENKHTYITASGTIGFNLINTSAANLISATALTLNTWHYVAATWDGANETIYIDGHFDASQVATGAVENATGTLAFAHHAQLAADDGTYNTFFDGTLDEIRWYSRALSASEVAALAAGNQ